MKPRSARQPRTRSLSSKAGGSLFGNARPREEILQQRGVDVQNLDTCFERKAKIYHDDQQEQLNKVRNQLATIHKDWKFANQNELPEAKFRGLEEAKRKELNDLLEQFDKANAATDNNNDTPERTTAHPSFSSFGDQPPPHRDSWRKEEKKQDDDDDDQAFANFHSNRRRHREQKAS